MQRPTKPGQKCRVVGGRGKDTGEAPSLNLGKTVTTMFLHQLQAGDAVPVWHCRGENLFTYYGNGSEADFLNYWLEVIEELPIEPVSVTNEQEITIS